MASAMFPERTFVIFSSAAQRDFRAALARQSGRVTISLYRIPQVGSEETQENDENNGRSGGLARPLGLSDHISAI
jgi:hypothetical protein